MTLDEMKALVSADTQIVITDANKIIPTVTTLVTLLGPFLPAAQQKIATEGLAVIKTLIEQAGPLSTNINGILTSLEVIQTSINPPPAVN